jgi:transcriptional regulator with PAS, ATPase and Fis domain
MAEYLCTWIGKTDLRAQTESSTIGCGPIANAAKHRNYDAIHLLSDFPQLETKSYIKWLKAQTQSAIHLHPAKLSSPIHFGDIYRAVASLLESLKPDRANLTYHLSPGTPAMQSVWILLGKTIYPARLIQSSEIAGVLDAIIPFDISAEFLPGLLRRADEELAQSAQGLAKISSGFDDIIFRSDAMSKVVGQAQKVAIRSIPVLLEGESGTGKELVARAIHKAGVRASKPFIAVNCGAISPELAESEFFGHKKGSFTGATDNRKGCFEQANGGTLFLDEIGDLPLPLQVKLLRALQNGEVTPLGTSTPQKVDVRVVAATNKHLVNEIAAGRFREDLFYRLAVAVIKLPPLRDRAGDLGLLVDRMLEKINETVQTVGASPKRLSPAAKTRLAKHDWPGNVRELQNTLQRAVTWSDADTIDLKAMNDAVLSRATNTASSQDIPLQSIREGISLEKVLANVARSYIEQALEITGNNKTRAAQLLNLGSHQTLTNWMVRYRIKA